MPFRCHGQAPCTSASRFCGPASGFSWRHADLTLVWARRFSGGYLGPGVTALVAMPYLYGSSEVVFVGLFAHHVFAPALRAIRLKQPLVEVGAAHEIACHVSSPFPSCGYGTAPEIVPKSSGVFVATRALLPGFFEVSGLSGIIQT